MIKTFPIAALIGVTALSACGLRPYSESPDTYIAVANDQGVDRTRIMDRRAAIAYDPDGCQNWIIDDGVEGYSSPRINPSTGLPNVCDNHYPPGAVVGNHQSPNRGLSDWVPAVSRK